MISRERKLRYLTQQQHRMQRLVDKMPDENEDKSRCQSDVNIVAELIKDCDEIEQLQQALKTYGKHLPNCTDVPLFCDCGLLKLINQSETTKDSHND